MRAHRALRKVVVAAVLAVVAVGGGAGVASADSRDQYRPTVAADDPPEGWCHCGDPT